MLLAAMMDGKVGYTALAKRKQKPSTQQQQQPYDNVLKSLIEGHELDMWDNLLEEDEYLQKKIASAAEKRAEKLAKELVEKRLAEVLAEVEKKLAEEARIRAESEMQASQTILIDVVQTRFPALVELARQRAAQTKHPDALREVIRLISTAPDEATARWILSLIPAA